MNTETQNTLDTTSDTPAADVVQETSTTVAVEATTQVAETQNVLPQDAVAEVANTIPVESTQDVPAPTAAENEVSTTAATEETSVVSGEEHNPSEAAEDTSFSIPEEVPAQDSTVEVGVDVVSNTATETEQEAAPEFDTDVFNYSDLEADEDPEVTEAIPQEILVISNAKDFMNGLGECQLFVVEEFSIPEGLTPIVLSVVFSKFNKDTGNYSFLARNNPNFNNQFDVLNMMLLTPESDGRPLMTPNGQKMVSLGSSDSPMLLVDLCLSKASGITTKDFGLTSEENNIALSFTEENTTYRFAMRAEGDAIYVFLIRNLPAEVFDKILENNQGCKGIGVHFGEMVYDFNFCDALETLGKNLKTFAVFGCTETTIDFIKHDLKLKYNEIVKEALLARPHLYPALQSDKQ